VLLVNNLKSSQLEWSFRRQAYIRSSLSKAGVHQKLSFEGRRTSEFRLFFLTIVIYKYQKSRKIDMGSTVALSLNKRRNVTVTRNKSQFPVVRKD